MSRTAKIVLIVLLVLFCLGGLPAFGVWHGDYVYGYWPSGLGGLVLIVLIVLLLTGRL